MPSHYSTIGFRFDSGDDIAEFAQRLHKEAEAVMTRRGTYFRWQSASGAELWFQVSRKLELAGAHPHFNGRSRLKLRLTERIHGNDDTEMDGSFYGWVNPGVDADDGDYFLVFAATDFWSYAKHALPAVAHVQIAAFAHEVWFYESPQAYEASQEEEIKFASQFFVPAGTFVESKDDAPTAAALFAGHVVAAEAKTNEVTGRAFHWALVDSLGGTFDVVIDPEVLNDIPKVGGVLHGMYWLSGKIAEVSSEAPLLKKVASRLWPAG